MALNKICIFVVLEYHFFLRRASLI